MDSRQAMEQFLQERVKDPGRVQDALRFLEPFFCIIEKGSYPLVEESEDARKEIVATLSAVFQTRQQVTVDVLAANGDPVRHQKPRGEYWEEYGRGPVGWNWDLAQQLFFRDFRGPLTQCLGLDPEDDSLLDPFGTTAFHEIQHAVWEIIGEKLQPVLGLLVDLQSEIDLQERVSGNYMGRDNVVQALWHDAIKPSLLFYLGFIIGNDLDHAQRLQPLISLLPKAIPIGKRDEDGDTWLVFIA